MLKNEVYFKEDKSEFPWDSLGTQDLRLFFLLNMCVFCNRICISKMIPSFL